MPIGGGTFTVQNKILPGAYINFVSTGTTANMGARGVVALPLEMSWGEEGKIIAVSAADFNKIAKKQFGYSSTDPELLLMGQALKRASTLLLYRLNTGSKATTTVGGVKATAKYSGKRGNKLSVEIVNSKSHVNEQDETVIDEVTVITSLDGDVIDSQAVAPNVSNLASNDFVDFEVTGPVTANTGKELAGGTNGTVTGDNYDEFLKAVEVEAFNVIGYPGNDPDIKSTIAAFVKRLRNDEGRKVTGVLADYAGDDIGLINVANGVILANGTVLDAAKAVCWIAGATAGAEVNESLTNTAYDNAVDVDDRMTSSEIETAIKAGKFVFYLDNGKARVVTDINSLTTFTPNTPEDWTSNRVVRVMDGWANDVARIFGNSYLGEVTNSETGRQLFKADMVSLGAQYESIDAISNFDSADIEVIQGTGKRDVVVNCALQPNDSMEKLYMTVAVN